MTKSASENALAAIGAGVPRVRRTLKPLHRVAIILTLFTGCAVSLRAQTFNVLYNFAPSSGGNPKGTLVQGLNAEQYGTTQTNPPGTFAATLDGDYTLLAPVGGRVGPYAGLALGGDGNLYGTSANGGAGTVGQVFRVSPSGSLTEVYSFSRNTLNEPYAGLTLGPDGYLYGVTPLGGTNGAGGVFKLSYSGEFTTVYNFADGMALGNLCLGLDGAFYGTAMGNGANSEGSIFKVTPEGAFTLVYSFSRSSGATPWAGLTLARDGNLYGSTIGGGANGYGTIFRISPSGEFAALHSFGPSTDGHQSLSPLALGSDGNFYGTTAAGGASNYGTLYKITPSGEFTVLHDFQKSTDGSDTVAGLVQNTEGTFYGVASLGGSNNIGTLFSLNVGLEPFVITQPASGRAGVTVNILGQGFTGASAVSFHGATANFTVVSDTYLTATVPAGATSGQVTVTTAAGPLTSNRRFVVIP